MKLHFVSAMARMGTGTEATALEEVILDRIECKAANGKEILAGAIY